MRPGLTSAVAMAMAACMGSALAAGPGSDSGTQKPPSNYITGPPDKQKPPVPVQVQPVAEEPAQAPGAVAAAPQQPLRLLLLKGYEVKSLVVMSYETTKQYNDKASQPGVVLTLQKATSIAVCYYSIGGYFALNDATLDNQGSCDVRGADTDVYEFVQSAQSSIAMFRLNTLTGEVGYCAYDRKEGQQGTTVCNPPAPEAQGTKEIGPYKLIAHKRDDPSVFRVNLQTGAMSICYPQTENNQTRVWCTNYAK